MERNTKEDIILRTLELGQEKGLANVSIQDIANAMGLRKSSLYSHFKSKDEIMQSILNHCKALLSKKDFVVDFKAKDAQDLLVSLLSSFMETFGEPPLSQYYAVVQQQRLFDKAFAEAAHEMESMITARIQVALEYCVQRSWLDIPDTDAASYMFSPCIQNCLAKLASSPTLGSDIDADEELDTLVDEMLSLFS